MSLQKPRPLLEGGHMTETTAKLRVRATLQGGKVSLAEFAVQGTQTLSCIAICHA